MRQLPEQCASCKRQIATLETCVLPDGTEKRGVEVTFRERRGQDTLPGVRERRTMSEPPYLHFGDTEGLLPGAVAVTGSPKALLKLRAQIEQALRDETYTFEDTIYRAANDIEFEVGVKRARSKGDMREPVPKPEGTAEKLSWGERARRAAEG